MDYISFQRNKIIFLCAVAFLIFISVAATFAYKDARFGVENLPSVLARLGEQAGYGLYYRIRFSLSPAVYATPDPERKARAVPALVYHAIDETGGEYTISKAEFADQMHALHSAGWRTVTLKEFEDFLRGQRELPERSFLLTFDDGAKESYYPVDPVLSALHMTAVTFILPKFSVDNGSHYYLSLGELRNMIESGRWEIGSHGQDSHQLFAADAKGTLVPALSRPVWLADKQRLETDEEYESRIEADLRISQHNLEQALSIPINAFAFPFGEFGQLNDSYPAAVTTVSRIAEGMYSMSFHQVRRGEAFSFNYPEPDPPRALLVKRIEPHPRTGPEELFERMENGLPKDLPFKDDFAKEHGWFSVWGPYDFTEGSLSLRASPEETGSALVLDGTRGWRDYRVRLLVEAPRRNGVYMWVRFQGNTQHAGCNFGNYYIHVEETLSDETSVIKGVRTENIAIPDGEFIVEARVNGRSLTCTLNDGVSVTSEFLNPALATGGIGIKIWDREPGHAQLIVKSVSVEPL